MGKGELTFSVPEGEEMSSFPLMHLGLGKTGTTFLQESLFKEQSRLGALFYIGPDKSGFASGQKPSIAYCNRIHDASSNHERVLVSNEKLLSGLPQSWTSEVTELYAQFPYFTPILVLRDPEEWVSSVVQQLIKFRPIAVSRSAGSTRSLADFVSKNYNSGVFCYERLLQEMVELYDSVIVVRYTPNNLISCFESILGVESRRAVARTRRVNVRLSEKAVTSKLRLNKFFAKNYMQHEPALPRVPLSDFYFPARVAEATRRLPAYLFLAASALHVSALRHLKDQKFRLRQDELDAIRPAISKNRKFLDQIFKDGRDIALVRKVA